MKKYNMNLFFISISPWPIFLSMSIMLLFINMVIFLNKSISYFFIFNLVLVLTIMFFWWMDVINESTYLGFHNSYILSMTICSMILFIVSEVLFFISFFWSFFHFMFSPNIELGSIWPYDGIFPMNFLSLPLLNSLLLISSGCSVTLSHHLIMVSKLNYSKNNLLVTIMLGAAFIFFQMFEYYTSFFSFSDGVFGSIFFMATGFHGIHVLIGSLFLFFMFLRMNKIHFSSKHLLGFEFSIWYWHFVDVVWLYLYMMVYWIGS